MLEAQNFVQCLNSYDKNSFGCARCLIIEPFLAAAVNYLQCEEARCDTPKNRKSSQILQTGANGRLKNIKQMLC
jgi:hypothetical protein